MNRELNRQARSYATETCGWNYDGTEKEVIIEEERDAFLEGSKRTATMTIGWMEDEGMPNEIISAYREFIMGKSN